MLRPHSPLGEPSWDYLSVLGYKGFSLLDKGGDRGIPVSASLPIPLFLPPRPQGPALVRTVGRTLSATELGFPASLKGEREGKLPQSWKSFHFPELSSFLPPSLTS